MHVDRALSHRLVWIVLCCLVPFLALGATLFLNTPIMPTALVALLMLIPLAARLLANL